jgi:hypothetical protein
VDAQHLAKQSCGVLRIAARFDVTRARVIAAAAVASCDVKIALITQSRTEADPAAVVIGLWLIDLSEPATSIRIFPAMGMSLRLKTRIGNPPAMNDRISAYDLAATNTLVP